MNFEVMCFDWVDDSLQVVNKEYFDTYNEALEFEKTDSKYYEGGISILPLNPKAEEMMMLMR